MEARYHSKIHCLPCRVTPNSIVSYFLAAIRKLQLLPVNIVVIFLAIAGPTALHWTTALSPIDSHYVPN